MLLRKIILNKNIFIIGILLIRGTGNVNIVLFLEHSGIFQVLELCD